METKQCIKCQEVKPLTEFAKSTQRPSGYQNHCKVCDNIRKRESEKRIREADPVLWSERQKKYFSTYKQKHPDRVKEQDYRRNLKDRFGLTVEQYDEMLRRQGGVCICGTAPGAKRLAVDHDWKCCPSKKSCGKCVRGLLCSNCNTALGLLKENKETIAKLLDYMEKHANTGP